MSGEYILVTAAWPYASADIHQGNVSGSYLPADIFARYHRLAGNKVLMVSGSDSHGTPVTVKADSEGKSPQEIFQHYHGRFLELFVKLGLTYDHFTHTDTENHHAVAQEVFRTLGERGYLYRQVSKQMYSSASDRFLPDRYVEGTCPNCGFTRARGDQCDNCNSLFESAAELLDPKSKTDDSELELRDTEHFFLDLAKLSEVGLAEWIAEGKEFWRPQVIKYARNLILREGLHGRAYTRDMDWGVKVPVEGWEGKVLYVWFEAVIGYLSAAIEWSAIQDDDPESWHKWWYRAEARTYYFIGKDNIPFHAVYWPAQLLGVQNIRGPVGGVLNMPFDVPANEFMNMEGRKISGSQNWGVWMLDALERYEPDSLRYYLTATMPETSDSEWTWQSFVERNNSELVGNWGNLANRVLRMIGRYFDGVVPDPGELEQKDKDFLAEVDSSFARIGEQYDACRFKSALQGAMALSTLANQYLENTSPWLTAKNDLATAGRSLYVALQAVNAIKMLLAPVLPFSSQKLHEMLGEDGQLFGEQIIRKMTDSRGDHDILTYDASMAIGSWGMTAIPHGRVLSKVSPLFRKLEQEVVAAELERLHGVAA